MSFTYSGAESESFAVTGLSGRSRSGASAVRFDGPPTLLMVSGTQLRTSTQLDFLDFVMPTMASATRIAGTFEGTAQTLTLQEETPRVLTITNGKFDVPLVPLEDLRRASP